MPPGVHSDCRYLHSPLSDISKNYSKKGGSKCECGGYFFYGCNQDDLTQLQGKKGSRLTKFLNFGVEFYVKS